MLIIMAPGFPSQLEPGIHPLFSASSHAGLRLHGKWRAVASTGPPKTRHAKCEDFGEATGDNDWLVVLTILTNISQGEGLSHIYGEKKNAPNHQPDEMLHSIY